MSTHGGKRAGSGPKTSPGPYGEATEVIRIPKSARPVIVSYLEALKRSRKQEAVANLPELLLPAIERSLVLLYL